MSEPFHEECLLRIQKLQQHLHKNNMAAFIVTQNVSIYYFTGSMQAGFLFIPVSGEAIFFVRRSVERAYEETKLSIVPLSSLSKFGYQLLEHSDCFNNPSTSVTIAIDADVCPGQLTNKLSTVFSEQLHATLVDGSTMLRTVRMVKSPAEIASIERAAYVLDEALAVALQQLKVGMTELELMAHIEFQLRIRGHQGILRVRSYNMEVATGMLGAGEAIAEPGAFDGPAAGRGLGPTAAQSSSTRPIGLNEPILIDVGCCIDGYLIDQTRTAVIGELSPTLLRSYEYTVTILSELEKMLRPGTSCEQLHVRALELAEQYGLTNHFMGYATNRVKFIGHGIGLEVDEWPILAKGSKHSLEAGMVVAIEPKFTFPHEGVVGIENSYLITPDGYRKLSVTPDQLLQF